MQYNNIRRIISDPNYDTNDIPSLLKGIGFNNESNIPEELFKKILLKASENCQVTLLVRSNITSNKYDKILLTHMLSQENVGYLKRWVYEIGSSIEYIMDMAIENSLINIVSYHYGINDYRLEDRFNVIMKYLRDGHESDINKNKILLKNIVQFINYAKLPSDMVMAVKIAYINSPYFNDSYFDTSNIYYNARRDFYMDLPAEYQLGVIL